jgi:hypothetical protein
VKLKRKACAISERNAKRLLLTTDYGLRTNL